MDSMTQEDECLIINDPLPSLEGMVVLKPNDPSWLEPSPLYNLDDEVDRIITEGVGMDADAITIESKGGPDGRRKAATHWIEGNPIASSNLHEEEIQHLRRLIRDRMRYQHGMDESRIMHEGRFIKVSWHDDIAVLGIGFNHRQAIDAAKIRCDGRLDFGRPTLEQVERSETRRLSAMRIHGLHPIPFEVAVPVIKGAANSM